MMHRVKPVKQYVTNDQLLNIKSEMKKHNFPSKTIHNFFEMYINVSLLCKMDTRTTGITTFPVIRILTYTGRLYYMYYITQRNIAVYKEILNILFIFQNSYIIGPNFSKKKLSRLEQLRINNISHARSLRNRCLHI